MNVLAIDVGTSATKAALLGASSGKPMGPIARVTHALDQPDPDTATLPTERLWRAVVQACRQATTAGPPPEGVGFSVLTPGLILADADGQPLTPIVTHLDRRARAEARKAWTELSDRYLRSAGNRPLPGGISATSFQRLVHIHPELRGNVRHYLHVNGWLGLVLTGVAAFDRANACFSGLLDATGTADWSPEWCGYFGVDPGWLPKVTCGTTTLGPLRAAVAHELGLPPGIPVKIGTADTSCAVLAAGMTCTDLLHVVGTTQVLAAIVGRPQPAPIRLTRLLGVGPRFLHVTHNPVGGVALDWIRQLCFGEMAPEAFYREVLPSAAERRTEVVLDPPFLGGDRLEIEPRRAAFRELGLSVDRLDLLAAILEAMRKGHAEALSNLGVPGPFSRHFLSGGGAETVTRILPPHGEGAVILLEEASLRGVAALFR